MLTAYNSQINDPCGRIEPIKKFNSAYDFIVVGGKVMQMQY